MQVIEQKININDKELEKKLLEGPAKVVIPSHNDYYIDSHGSIRRRLPKKRIK